MCLASANLDAIATCATDLKDAIALRKEANEWQDDDLNSDADFSSEIGLTADEARGVLDARIERLKEQAKELGIYGPAAKADSGTQQRILTER